uniref:DB domain-containing protein n=1 Tax=Caenorhabditis tropicalis TaxID=1561998 RepID=A0A1I7TDS7_9PELO
MHNFHALLLLLIVPMMIHGMQLPPSPSPLKVSSSSPATDTLALFGIPKDLWKCGPGPGYVSDQIIQRMNEACPLAAADFNHCCAIHDDCYSNQRGRSQCDQDFCGCMSYHVKHNLNAANCSQQTLAACGLVERYGEQFYNAASQSPVDPAKRLPEEFPSITEEYEKLYKACEKQYATIASCALNFDICYRSPGNRHEKCVVDFQRCLDATHLGRDLDQQCDAAIEMVQWKMVEKVETGGNVTVLVLAEVQNNTITFVKKV